MARLANPGQLVQNSGTYCTDCKSAPPGQSGNDSIM